MLLRLIKSQPGKEETFECSRYDTEKPSPDSITFILQPSKEKISIPQDGHTVFVMESGRTVQTYRIQEESKKEGNEVLPVMQFRKG